MARQTMDILILALWTVASAIMVILPCIPMFIIIVAVAYVVYVLTRITCQLDRRDRQI
jgi:hypothetical protein